MPDRGAPRVVVFTERERSVVERAAFFADKHRSEYRLPLAESRRALEGVAESITCYPSVLDAHSLGGSRRTADTLIKRMAHSSEEDRTLETPTRAVLGRALLTAKIQYFALIQDMYAAHDGPKQEVRPVREHLYTNVFTLLVEEVLMSILEDAGTSDEIRSRGAELLIHLWERRLVEDVARFAPALFSMWDSRRGFTPIYGTLMGTSELFHLNRDAHGDWFAFLAQRGHLPDVGHALEEFLFNLSFEELTTVRSEMERRGLGVVDSDDVDEILSKHGNAPVGDGSHHQWIYSFYQRRRINAWFRREARIPGPHKTIEEHLITFLLAQRAPLESPDTANQEVSLTS